MSEPNLGKGDIGVWIVAGVAGFAVGFLRFLPEMSVYGDQIYFISAIILGILNFIIFFLLGIGASLIRRHRLRNKKYDLDSFSSPSKRPPEQSTVSEEKSRDLYNTIVSEYSQE